MKREDLAAKILIAMITSPPLVNRANVNEHIWARKAIRFADALLRQFTIEKAAGARTRKLTKWTNDGLKNRIDYKGTPLE